MNGNIDGLIPEPFNSDTEFNRFYHRDIPKLENSELRDEYYALRPLLWGLPIDNWLRQRVAKLGKEISVRSWMPRKVRQ